MRGVVACDKGAGLCLRFHCFGAESGNVGVCEGQESSKGCVDKLCMCVFMYKKIVEDNTIIVSSDYPLGCRIISDFYFLLRFFYKKNFHKKEIIAKTLTEYLLCAPNC